jgi:osmotically-inducible protein OsmY
MPTDDEIRQNAEHALTWSPEIDQSGINVSVSNGIVTLTGTVDVYWKKLHAANAVQNLIGVLSVDNKLAITPRRDLVDKAVAQDIVAAIDRNPLVEAPSISVMVQNGDVTLAGTVRTWAAREAAYRSALYTAGVTDIVDRIAVRS